MTKERVLAENTNKVKDLLKDEQISFGKKKKKKVNQMINKDEIKDDKRESDWT